MKKCRIIGEGFDIIGDIHGYNEPLKRLLSELGYQETQGVWSHQSRTAIFVGDLIDRGAGQREVCTIVQKMVEAGHAYLCLGNHEFNAVGYYTPKSTGDYLRPHSDNNIKQHQSFIDEYPLHSDEHKKLIQWFKNQPLWLELETKSGAQARVIHACWNHQYIEKLKDYLHYNGQAWVMGDQFDQRFFDSNEEAFELIEFLLKGPEIDLPAGGSYLDKGKKRRTRARVNWWNPGQTWADSCLFGGFHLDGFDPHSPCAELPCAIYQDEIPVFFGHYWMDGSLKVQTSKVACLDWSIAKAGQLVAYRWDGESELQVEKMVAVS